MALKVEIEQKEKTAFFEWDEGVLFEIKYIPRQRRKEIAKKATSIVFVRHQRREEYDPEKFGELLLKEAIVGWKGLKYKHLMEICEPDFKILADPEEEIPFDDENKDFIIKHRTINFENFIVYAVDKWEDLRREELKNLKTTSTGSKVPVDSPKNR